MKFLSLIAFYVLFISTDAQAMFAAIYGEQREAHDVNRRTHFVIAGIGKELLLKTQEAAMTKALYLKKIFPQDQIIFLSNWVDPEVATLWTEIELVYYSRSRDNYMQNLSTVPMIDYMDLFPKIASIEYFGHSNIHNGLILAAEYMFGLAPSQQKYAAKLKNNFTEDAYVILFGCNSGWTLAPLLSELWDVPVAGSFTGTIFERVGSNGRFYDVDSKTIPFPESNMGVPCSAGACLRMVVQNAPYNGYWGRLEVDALNFFKFFCKGITDHDRCLRGMAYAMIGSVHGYKNLVYRGRINPTVYRLIVSEFLCSKNWQGSRDNCLQFLNTFDFKSKRFGADRTSFFMLGGVKQLHATFQGHNYKVVSIDDKNVRGGFVKRYEFTSIENIKNVDTLAREFEAYIEAFKFVKDISF